jgi:ribonuclease VapC
MTMVIDASAIVAILLQEEGWQRLGQAIIDATNPLMSLVNLYEAGIVMLGKRGPEGVRVMHTFVELAHITVVEFSPNDARLSTDIYQQFGKGRHRAGLNLADCPAYLLAQQEQAPLLFVGDDFLQTDIQPAITNWT